MRGKKILFVDEDKKNQKLGNRVLSSTGAAVFTPDSYDQALDLIITQEFDVVFADFNSKKILEATVRLAPNTKTVLLTSDNMEVVVDYLKDQPFIGNLLAKNSDSDHYLVNVRDLLITTNKLFTNDLFGIEKYLHWGVSPIEYYIRQADERDEYLQSIIDYCYSLGCRKSQINIVTRLCDELLLNALMDAPFDSMKNHNLEKRGNIKLPPNLGSKFSYASDGRYIVISVEDSFGGLKREHIIKYLRKCFARKETDSIIDIKPEGGAGLGIYLIWNSVNQFIVNLDPGIRTECIGIIDLSMKPRAFKSSNKSLHIFNTWNASRILMSKDKRLKKDLF